MSLPTLTKNEKLILFSVILVLTLFWTVVGGYVWFKTKGLQENSEQTSNVKNPLAFLEKTTPNPKSSSEPTPQIFPQNPQISPDEIVTLDKVNFNVQDDIDLPIILLDSGTVLITGRVEEVTEKGITLTKQGRKYYFGPFKGGHINYMEYEEEKETTMGREWTDVPIGELIYVYLFYSEEKGEYEAVQAWLGRNLDLENYKKRL